MRVASGTRLVGDGGEDALHKPVERDVAALQVLRKVGGLRDVFKRVPAQQVDDALAALSLGDPAPAFSARVCAAAGASAPAPLGADFGGVGLSGMPPSGVPALLTQWTLPHPVQSMRGGSEYKHGFGAFGYGGVNFSGELSKGKWGRVSRADFDEYYDPSDFVDRAYGGIDGSAAGGEGL